MVVVCEAYSMWTVGIAGAGNCSMYFTRGPAGYTGRMEGCIFLVVGLFSLEEKGLEIGST